MIKVLRHHLWNEVDWLIDWLWMIGLLNVNDCLILNGWLIVNDWLIVFFLAEINITHLALSTRGFTGQCPYHQHSLLSIHIFLSIYVSVYPSFFLSICVFVWPGSHAAPEVLQVSVPVSGCLICLSKYVSVCLSGSVYHWQEETSVEWWIRQSYLSMSIYLSVCLALFIIDRSRQQQYGESGSPV